MGNSGPSSVKRAVLRFGPFVLLRSPAVAGALVIVVAAVAGVPPACPSSTSVLAAVNGSVEAVGVAEAAVALSCCGGLRRQLAPPSSTSPAPSAKIVVRTRLLPRLERWITPLRYLNHVRMVVFFSKSVAPSRYGACGRFEHSRVARPAPYYTIPR